MNEIEKRYIELKKMPRLSLVVEFKMAYGSTMQSSAYSNHNLIELILESEFGVSHI